MINKQRIIEKAAAYGLDIAPIAPALDRYAEILVDYNKKVNLTAIVDPEGIEDKHFIDSLLFAAQRSSSTSPHSRPMGVSRSSALSWRKVSRYSLRLVIMR